MAVNRYSIKKRMVGHKQVQEVIVRQCTAEQVLSHILPAIAGIVPATIMVKPDKQKIVMERVK